MPFAPDHHDDTHSLGRERFDPRIDINAIPFRPEERLISAVIVDSPEPQKPLSAIEALQLLAGAEKPEDIGKHGPLLASIAFPEHQSITELRLYEVVFGRDSLIAARLLADQFPALTRSTVLRLAELQGTTHNTAAEEEPGKIIHEARLADDPIAQELTRTRGWEWPYYGTIDATPLFMSAAARYILDHDQDFIHEPFAARDQQTKTIGQAIDAAAKWLQQKMDQNPEGLLESLYMNKIGSNMIQSWKDSVDSHHHSDGSLPNFSRGIASIEVQGYVYDALLNVAELYTRIKATSAMIQDLTNHAARLRDVILNQFWVASGSFFALGSDRDDKGNLRLLDVRASNMGHLLNSRLLDGKDAKIKSMRDNVVNTLLSPSLRSQRGIRTLARNENRYRPRSYHNGSVWPWDTNWIALGLKRQGYLNEAQDLCRRTLNIISTTKCFPEFVSGDDSDHPLPNRVIKVHNVINDIDYGIEQPPQRIQAWTVASAVAAEHLLK